MATLNLTNALVATDMTDATRVDHNVKVSASLSSWVWTTTSGYTVTATSILDDVSGGATPTAGTIFSLSAQNGTDLIYDVSDMAGNLVAMTQAPNLEGYWRAILAGDTTILAPRQIFFSGSGDFLTVSGETVTGGNDLYLAQPGTASFHSFAGDALNVAATGVLNGGADRFFIRGEGAFSGDAGNNAGKVVGGNDTFTVEVPAPGNHFISGDASGNSGDLVGGNDKITVRLSPPLDAVVGDVDIQSAGTLMGGDDTLIFEGSTGSFAIAGDVELISGGTLFAGADTIVGSTAANVIYGDYRTKTGGTVTTDATHTGNDFIDGGGGGDTLNGQIGDDRLRGGDGADVLDGGEGRDAADYVDKATSVAVTLNGPVDATVFVNGAAEDTVRNIESVIGGSAGDALTGDAFDNLLTGNDGADVLDGGLGADTLDGGSGLDTLVGGAGRDILSGGAGNDILTGGADKDVFLFDTTRAPTNIDTLTDFSHADVVELDKDIFRKIARGKLDDDAFLAKGHATEARDAEDRIILTKSTGELRYDKDGVGGADAKLFAILTGSLHGINHNDFLIVG